MKETWRRPLSLLTADPALAEQTQYNGRRLAKLGATIGQIVAWLGRRRPRWSEADIRTVELIVTRAYIEVREAEIELFEHLFRAEVESRTLGETLRRFEEGLRQYANAARVRIRYPEARAGGRARCTAAAVGTLWSIPLGREGAIELEFPKYYPWLPRELEVLAIAAERCLAAGDKARRAEESRRLAATLTEIAERERRRISQELHDEAGQSMLVIRLMLETIEREAPPVLRDRVREAREATERTVVEIRRILSALSPEVLEKLGLSAAIRQLGTRLRWAYPARLRTDIGDLPRLPAKLELVVYRLAQECLNNAAKHAQAKNVKVSLHNADGVIKLGVSDDGLGFDVGQTAGRNGSYGIGGMRDRVALLGGRMEIDSRPGRGTRVSVELPVPGEERN